MNFSTYSLEELSKGLLKAKEKKIWNEDGPGSIDKASRLASNLLMKLNVQGHLPLAIVFFVSLLE